MKPKNDYAVFAKMSRVLDDATDIWFGQSDVQTAFWLALRRGNYQAMAINWDELNGLRMEPDLSSEIAKSLNSIIAARMVRRGMVRAAIIRALRQEFGRTGGIMLVWRDERHLRLNLARFREVLPYVMRSKVAQRVGLWLN